MTIGLNLKTIDWHLFYGRRFSEFYQLEGEGIQKRKTMFEEFFERIGGQEKREKRFLSSYFSGERIPLHFYQGNLCFFCKTVYLCKRKKQKFFERRGRYQSGQLGQTVTLLTYVFVGSNPALPTNFEVSKRKYFFFVL